MQIEMVRRRDRGGGESTEEGRERGGGERERESWKRERG